MQFKVFSKQGGGGQRQEEWGWAKRSGLYPCWAAQPRVSLLRLCMICRLSVGPAQPAPGNPARRNMVAATAIQPTHTQPYAAFVIPMSWDNIHFTPRPPPPHSSYTPFSQTLSIQTPCRGARVKRMTLYKVASDAHTHIHTHSLAHTHRSLHQSQRGAPRRLDWGNVN